RRYAMTRVRWDPLQELVGWSQRLNRSLAQSAGGRPEESYGSWAPPVDIYEKDHDLIIHAEIPGVDRNDIEVRSENGVLTLRGERKRGAEVAEEGAYRLERTYGGFSRSFALPTTVDPSRVAAVYRGGVLELTVPKLEAAKPKRIEIKAA